MAKGQESLFQRVCKLQQQENGRSRGDRLDVSFIIAYLIKRFGFQQYVELGMEGGETLLSASVALENDNGKAYGVALFQNNNLHEYHSILERKTTCGLDARVTIIRMTSQEAFHYFESIELEYRDATSKNGVLSEGNSGSGRDFMIDLLHINNGVSEDELAEILCLYEPIIPQGGIIVLSGLNALGRRKIFEEQKHRYTVLLDQLDFVVLLKDGDLVVEYERFIKDGIHPLKGAQARHLQGMLPYVLENLHELGKADDHFKIPSIFVGIMTYNTEDYIEQCLYSIMEQQGNFTIDIGVFDDASTDRTVARVRNIRDIPSHVTLTLYENQKNGGFSQNYIRVFNQFAKSDCAYFACIDGDDYLSSTVRFQTHLQMLSVHPECAVSFNAMLMYYQKNKTFEAWYEPNNPNKDVYTAFDVANYYFIGNGSCSFIRKNAVQNIPKELFTKAEAGDWIMHMIYSRHGDILHIKEFMNVYRKHMGGAWSSKNEQYRHRSLYKSLREFNKITHYQYYNELYNHIYMNYNAINETSVEYVDILIVDDVFPHAASGFRYAEFMGYLNHFNSVRILCHGGNTHLLGKKSNREVMMEFKQKHPKFADSLVEYTSDCGIMDVTFTRPKLAYFCLLGNAWANIDWVERKQIPFVFELYPGGSFSINDSTSDARLRRVLKSPCFSKVIVTQDVTRDYLLEKKLCREEDIVEIFGVVTPPELLSRGLPDKSLLIDRPLNICFAAQRYTSDGSDKGYDIFLEAVHVLVDRSIPVQVHVAGGFDEKVIPLEGLEECITFHGSLRNDALHAFYEDMDIIVSPNVDGRISSGAFDGFPTGACTEAGLCGVLMMCSDPMGLNNDRFVPGEDIEILPRSASAIADRVEYYHNNRPALKEIIEKQYAKLQKLYGTEPQIGQRIAVLERELVGYRSRIAKIIGSNQMTPDQPQGWYTGYLYHSDSLAGFVFEKRIPFQYYLNADGDFIADIDLRWLAGASSYFRLDFIDNEYATCKFFNIRINDRLVKILSSNGVCINNRYVFDTNHPYVVLGQQDIPQTLPAMMYIDGNLQFVKESVAIKSLSNLKKANLYYCSRDKEYTIDQVLEVGYGISSNGKIAFSADLNSIGLQDAYLRLDILEHEYCQCIFETITIDDKPLQILDVNGCRIGETYYFNSTDPNIMLGHHVWEGQPGILKVRAQLTVLDEDKAAVVNKSIQTGSIYTSSLYGKSYTECRCFVYLLNEESFDFSLKVSDYCGNEPTYLRIDLMEDVFCTLELYELTCDGKALGYETNGTRKDNGVAFLNTDPQILLKSDISAFPQDAEIHLRGKVHRLSNSELSDVLDQYINPERSSSSGALVRLVRAAQGQVRKKG